MIFDGLEPVQLGAQVPLLGFERAQVLDQGGGFFVRGHEVPGDALAQFFVFAQLLRHPPNLALDAFLITVLREGKLRVSLLDHLRIEHELEDLLDHRVLQLFFVDHLCVAIHVPFCAAARIIFTLLAVFGSDRDPIHDRPAARAIQNPAEDERAIVTARVLAVHFPFERIILHRIFAVPRLHHIPNLLSDNRLGVFFDEHISVAHLPQVDAIGEKSGVGIDRPENVEFAMDFSEGCALGTQLKSLAADINFLRIRHPAPGDVLRAVAPLADLELLAHKTEGRRAGDCSVGGGVELQPAADVNGHVFAEFVVHPVQQRFVDTPVGGVGDLVLDGVDDVAAPAQISSKILGVVDITAEAGELPEDEPGIGAVSVSEVIDHVAELAAADGGAARPGHVGEDAAEHQVIFIAPLAEVLPLLRDGEILVVPA